MVQQVLVSVNFQIGVILGLVANESQILKRCADFGRLALFTSESMEFSKKFKTALSQKKKILLLNFFPST